MMPPTPTTPPEDQIAAAAELGACLRRARAEITALAEEVQRGRSALADTRGQTAVAYERGRIDGWRECGERALSAVRRWPVVHGAVIAATQNPPDDVTEPDR